MYAFSKLSALAVLFLSLIFAFACKTTPKKTAANPPKDSLLVYGFMTTPSKTALTNGGDTLLYSFVTVGCNRVDKDDIAEDNPSSGNVIQLRKTFEEVSQLKPVPDYFFFTGDMVMGYVKFDTAKLAKELSAWRNIFETSTLAKTKIKLVAVPGNHELLISKKASTGMAEEKIWLREMAPFVRGSNGPKKGGKDSLDNDESKMSYSFDYKGSHFVMLNTDGMGQECRAPKYWVNDDLEKARANNPAHIFVFSHIPPYGAPKMNGPVEQLDDNYAFWDVLEKNKADAMFSAHDHVYCRLLPHPGKTSMVISGNGGSPLNERCTEAQKFYGYTLVKVYKSGKVITCAMGRPVPKAGYMAPVDGPTTPRDSANISWGSSL
jgi:hypothetical protein